MRPDFLLPGWRHVAAGLALLVVATSAARGADPAPVSFRVAALVQAGPARWPEIPGDAVIARAAPDRFRRPFVEPGPGIPSGSPAVKRALAAALVPLSPGDRTVVRKVLNAIGDWAASSLAEDRGPVVGPAEWRDAARVLADRRGNSFELARALCALARAAGIPARPSFNGVPVVVVFTGAPGAWTVWDPVHPGAASRLLPVAWLPLRGGDLPPVAIEPRTIPGTGLVVAIRRHLDRDAAAREVEAVRTTGDFLPAPPPPLRADAPGWWEAWMIGATVVPPAGRWSATVALPYVRELDYGTRDQAVWVSDPARIPVATGPLSETDPAAGGIVMTLKLSFPPAAR